MRPSDEFQTDTAVVILAGGKGRRIGGAKAERRLGGVRMIDRMLRLACGFSPHVAVSVADRDKPDDLEVPLLIDTHPDWGALAGLAAAMDYARSCKLDSIMTLPCDTPFLPEDLLDRLYAGRAPGQAAAIPRSGGRLHYACGLWRTASAKLLNEYAAGGGRSLHGLAERIGFSIVEWPDAPIDPFFNINTPADLQHAEGLLWNNRIGA